MKKQKTGNRKKRVTEKITVDVKAKINCLLSRYHSDQMFADFMELKPGERLKIFASFAEYSAPKLNRTELEERANPENSIKIYLPDNGRN